MTGWEAECLTWGIEDAEPERTRAEWWQMAHKFHVATDGTCYPQHHVLCPHCNPQFWTGTYDSSDEPIPTALYVSLYGGPA